MGIQADHFAIRLRNGSSEEGGDLDLWGQELALGIVQLPDGLVVDNAIAIPIVRALRAGAAGIVGKHEPLDVLVDAIAQVAAGEPLVNPEWAAVAEGDPELAPREAEAVRLYAAGLPLKSVARRMALSHETVKEYLLRARRKYAAAGRPAQTKTDLFRRAVEDGYLEAP